MHVGPLAPGTTPEALACRLARRPGLAWLDGDGSRSDDGRYSFVSSDPVQWCIESERSEAALDAMASVASSQTEPTLAAGTVGPIPPQQIVPRWIGYLAYTQPAFAAQSGASAPPALCFARYDAVAVFDHHSAQAWLVGDDAEACERMATRVRAPVLAPHADMGEVMGDDPAHHAAAIEQALQHIARGDIYQVNLARSFVASFAGDALALALAMRTASPVPLGFYFEDGQRAIVTRSMERFLRFTRDDRVLVTKPIKGTIARSAHDARDADALQGDPKERAEHTMIIDLMRNDLGRVAQLGSVRVSAVMAVEPYARLSHLVSTVQCVTRPQLGVGAIVTATFPPGSVTGTPKLRAMQIIDALEPRARGVYTGAVGYVDRRGGLSLAVAIRTATVEGGRARYFAGGGIVEASQVARELAETELKARVFLDAAASLRAPCATEANETRLNDSLALSHPPVLR